MLIEKVAKVSDYHALQFAWFVERLKATKEGDGMLDLARFSTVTNAAALEDREHWELAGQELRAGEMPPKGLPRPPADKVAAVIE